MSPLTIAHGNVYAPNARRRPRRVKTALRALGADSIGLNEGHTLVPRAAGMRGYRLHHPQYGLDRRGALDTPILVRRTLEPLGAFGFRASRAAPAYERVAPDRWINVALYRHPVGKVAHVCIHPVAGPKVLIGKDPQHPLVRRYASLTTALGTTLTMLDDLSYLLIVTGDVQVPQHAPVRPWSVYPVLDAAGLSVTSEGIDLIAYDKRLTLTGRRIVPPAVTGSDHPWIVATLARVGGRR